MDDRLLECIYRYVDGDCSESEADEVRQAVRDDPGLVEELFRAALDRTLLVEVLARSGTASPVPGKTPDTEMARLVVREGEGWRVWTGKPFSALRPPAP